MPTMYVVLVHMVQKYWTLLLLLYCVMVTLSVYALSSFLSHWKLN